MANHDLHACLVCVADLLGCMRGGKCGELEIYSVLATGFISNVGPAHATRSLLSPRGCFNENAEP